MKTERSLRRIMLGHIWCGYSSFPKDWEAPKNSRRQKEDRN
jgi:hypothetical protein